MDKADLINVPFVNSVLHPSDFSKASENAFAHALAIALIRETKLVLLNVGKDAEDWREFPSVRTTLERWGFLEEGSDQAEVYEKLNVKVKKIGLGGNRPVPAILGYLKDNPTDLIVLATNQKEGVPRWFQPSKAEKIAKKSNSMTLFIPNTGSGFVSLADGKFHLRRILVPIAHQPDPLPSVEYAARVARLMIEPVEVILFHAGDATEIPFVELPDDPICTWRKTHKQGDIVQEIENAIRQYEVDLIIMTTAGKEGFLDALRGSVTQQIIRRAPCPVLAVPEWKY
ncbi:MAG: universal stress protein [Calditrichia bacterium]